MRSHKKQKVLTQETHLVSIIPILVSIISILDHGLQMKKNVELLITIIKYIYIIQETALSNSLKNDSFSVAADGIKTWCYDSGQSFKRPYFSTPDFEPMS